MRYDFIDWVRNNHETIKIVFDGIKAIAELYIGIVDPPIIEIAAEISTGSSYVATVEKNDIKELYQQFNDLSDFADAASSLFKKDENEGNEEDNSNNNDNSNNEETTESKIDEIESVNEIHEEKFETTGEVLEADEDVTNNEEESLSDEELCELAQAYYYSHGQPKELSEVIFY